MLEHIGDGLGARRRVQRHADMPAHPDGQVGDDPVGAVFTENGDRRTGRQVQGFQVGSHAPSLVANLAPSIVKHSAIGTRLCQVDHLGCGVFPMFKPVQQCHLLL
ncbi:hypothetical protein D3C80_1382650 [compost metagenome]